MIEKFIQSGQVCFNVGYPTAFGWLILVALVLISIVAFVKNR